jgi:hypothetical protein
MSKPQLKKLATPLLILVLGVCVGSYGHELMGIFFKATKGGNSTEAMRVSSPDRKLDAVLVQDTSGGALGGVFWYVYVVPKGEAVPKDAARRLFFANDLTKGIIVWNKPHLVEVYYDKASITQFRNISTKGENGVEYTELRLAPSSEYSLLTPTGGWRSEN